MVSSSEVSYYNIDNDSWSNGQKLPYAICNHATVVDGDDIYVIGGDNGNKVIRCRNGTWQNLLNHREYHITKLDGNCIYVHGGNRNDNGQL